MFVRSGKMLPSTMKVEQPPVSMKAVHGTAYGDIDEVLSVTNGVQTPRLADLPLKVRKNYMVLKVLAVSLSPGDCRVLSGLTREIQGPPSFPFVPGGDCCGIVIELPEASLRGALPFEIGDRVAARFVGALRGALGEYALVSTLVADKVPEGVTSEEAAALISASPSVALAEYIQPGEQVLVLGAGGGIGAHFCQLLRLRGVSYVVGVSRSPDQLLKPPISCDNAIDYTTTNIFSMKKFKQNKFDSIVDFAGGGFGQLEECIKRGETLIVKTASSGGRFLTTVPPCGPLYEVHSMWAALKIFLFSCLWKAVVTRTFYRSKLPKYTFGMGLSNDRTLATRTMEYASSGTLKAVLDVKGPFPFTTEGVQAAYRLQECRHPQGKVIVSLSKL